MLDESVEDAKHTLVKRMNNPCSALPPGRECDKDLQSLIRQECLEYIDKIERITSGSYFQNELLTGGTEMMERVIDRLLYNIVTREIFTHTVFFKLYATRNRIGCYKELYREFLLINEAMSYGIPDKTIRRAAATIAAGIWKTDISIRDTVPHKFTTKYYLP